MPFFINPYNIFCKKIEYVVMMVSMLFLYTSAILNVYTPLSPDQMLFDYVAWNVLNGSTLYLDVFEINWPGKVWMHEIGLRLFGVTAWSFRALDSLVLIAVAFSLRLLFLRLRMPLAAATAPGLYAAIYVTSGAWFTGQRDVIAGSLLVVAIALATQANGGKRVTVAELLAAGAVMFIAVAMKPTFLTFPVGFIGLQALRLWLWGERAKRDSIRAASWLTVGLLTPALVWIEYAAPEQAIGLFEQTIRFNLGVYTSAGSPNSLLTSLVVLLTTSWLWLTPMAVIGLSVWLILRGPSLTLLAIMGIIATTLLSYVLQNKGFMYQLGGMLPAFVVLAAAAPDLISRVRPHWTIARINQGLAVLLLFLMAVGTATKMGNLDSQAIAMFGGPTMEERARQIDLAEQLRAVGSDGAAALQWGRNYHAVMLAGRPTPWPFINVPLREGAHLSPFWPKWKEFAEAVLADPPPAAIVERKALIQPEEEWGTMRRMIDLLLKYAEVVWEDEEDVIFALPGNVVSVPLAP